MLLLMATASHAASLSDFSLSRGWENKSDTNRSFIRATNAVGEGLKYMAELATVNIRVPAFNMHINPTEVSTQQVRVKQYGVATAVTLLRPDDGVMQTITTNHFAPVSNIGPHRSGLISLDAMKSIGNHDINRWTLPVVFPLTTENEIFWTAPLKNQRRLVQYHVRSILASLLQRSFERALSGSVRPLRINHGKTHKNKPDQPYYNTAPCHEYHPFCVEGDPPLVKKLGASNTVCITYRTITGVLIMLIGASLLGYVIFVSRPSAFTPILMVLSLGVYCIGGVLSINGLIY